MKLLNTISTCGHAVLMMRLTINYRVDNRKSHTLLGMDVENRSSKIIEKGIARKGRDIILENTCDDNMNSIVASMVHRVLEAFF